MPRSAEHPTLPSVTEVLAACGLSQDYGFLGDKRAYYQDRGHALHAAIRWHAEGTLDETSLHEEIKRPFEAYLAWRERERWVWEAAELELTHPYGVIGHLDLVGTAPGVGTEILDIKLSESPDIKGARYQLAGYGLLWDHNHPDRPHRRRRVLQLTKDGQAKTHDVTDDYAVTVFKGALIVYLERQNSR